MRVAAAAVARRPVEVKRVAAPFFFADTTRAAVHAEEVAQAIADLAPSRAVGDL